MTVLISMDYDIIIVGAGPTGLSTALSLKDSGLEVLILDRDPLENITAPVPDGREIALTHLSVKIFKSLHCWQYLCDQGISPIKRAKVLDGDSLYFLDFESDNSEKDVLGYIVPNYLIRKSLYMSVESCDNVELWADTTVLSTKTDRNGASVTISKNGTNSQTINSKLVIAADSRFSATRRDMGIGASSYDFARSAIVCCMSHEKSNEKTAYECFHYGSTLAILPLNENMSSAVITVPNASVDKIMSMSEEEFNLDIENEFAGRLGKMQLVSERHIYPLTAVHADNFVTCRFAFVGDAAVGMHPVTAYGFNLGLRGQDLLTKSVLKAQSQGRDIGSESLLKGYEAKFMLMTKPMYWGTNSIVSLFTNEKPPAKVVRKIVLRLANNFPPLKRAIVSRLTETSGNLSGLIKPDKLKAKLPRLPKLPKLPFSRL